MNFMITLVGWFLWNWAEMSITKEEGEADVKKKISFRDYTRTHWETWIGSLVMMVVLLWAMNRQLSLDPFASLLGVSGVPLGWNDVYLLLSGAAWDAFIFGFKWVKNFFRKKTAQL